MNIKQTAAIVGSLAMLAASPVFAQGVGANVGATVGAGAGAKANVNVEARMTKGQERANQEIERRIQRLTDLGAKVQAMAKVSAEMKASISTEVSTEIANLTALKAKIAADTDATALKADVKSITDSYRIFMLVIPQGRIQVAADKMQTTVDSLTAIAAKIQARISTAKSAGKDTSALETTLADLNAKITDAGTQAQAAVSHTSDLKPDNGDKTVAANTAAALKQARADLKVGLQDLQAARKDIGTLLKGLVAFGDGANASVDASGSTGVSQ